MEKEIKNYKNEKQIQANSIKQKTQEIHAKNKMQEYEDMCSKNEEDNKNFNKNNQNHKTNKIEIHNIIP